MAAYTYRGDQPRYYPGLGIEATPGLTAEFDEQPGDGRWDPAPATTTVLPAVMEDDH